MNLLEIFEEWSGAKHCGKYAVLDRYAQTYNVSRSTIYRMLMKLKGRKKTVLRSAKIDPQNDLINRIARMKMYGYQGLSGRELASDLCRDILVSEGYTDAQSLTVSTINRRLNAIGFYDRDVIVRVEAGYANQQHQLDFSRSKYFQLFKYDSAAGDYLLRVTARSLSYKEDETSLRTWLVGVTDAYSRVSLAQAYAASGESVLIGIEFLNFVYTREDSTHPLVHLPDILKTDNGAFIKNGAVKMLLEKLGIKSELSRPMKKRGPQKREAAWKLIWKRFELPLYIRLKEGSTIHLKDYNAELHMFMQDTLDMKHPALSETRGHLYRTSIVQREQRVVDVDMKLLLTKPFRRIIDDTLCVTINNIKYQTTNPKLIGEKVICFLDMQGGVVAELIEKPGKPFTMIQTDGFVQLGDFSGRHPESYRQRIEREIEKEKKSKVQYLSARAKKIDVDSMINAVDPKINTIDAASDDYEFENNYAAKKYIIDCIGRQANYDNYASIFDPILTVTLRRDAIDNAINNLKRKAQ